MGLVWWSTGLDLQLPRLMARFPLRQCVLRLDCQSTHNQYRVLAWRLEVSVSVVLSSNCGPPGPSSGTDRRDAIDLRAHQLDLAHGWLAVRWFSLSGAPGFGGEDLFSGTWPHRIASTWRFATKKEYVHVQTQRRSSVIYCTAHTNSWASLNGSGNLSVWQWCATVQYSLLCYAMLCYGNIDWSTKLVMPTARAFGQDCIILSATWANVFC